MYITIKIISVAVETSGFIYKHWNWLTIKVWLKNEDPLQTLPWQVGILSRAKVCYCNKYKRKILFICVNVWFLNSGEMVHIVMQLISHFICSYQIPRRMIFYNMFSQKWHFQKKQVLNQGKEIFSCIHSHSFRSMWCIVLRYVRPFCMHSVSLFAWKFEDLCQCNYLSFSFVIYFWS